MITDETAGSGSSGWFAGRLPQEWQAEPAGITIDREEITVRLSRSRTWTSATTPARPTRTEARAGRAKALP